MELAEEIGKGEAVVTSLPPVAPGTLYITVPTEALRAKLEVVQASTEKNTRDIMSKSIRIVAGPDRILQMVSNNNSSSSFVAMQVSECSGPVDLVVEADRLVKICQHISLPEVRLVVKEELEISYPGGQLFLPLYGVSRDPFTISDKASWGSLVAENLQAGDLIEGLKSSRVFSDRAVKPEFSVVEFRNGSFVSTDGNHVGFHAIPNVNVALSVSPTDSESLIKFLQNNDVTTYNVFENKDRVTLVGGVSYFAFTKSSVRLKDFESVFQIMAPIGTFFLDRKQILQAVQLLSISIESDAQMMSFSISDEVKLLAMSRRNVESHEKLLASSISCPPMKLHFNYKLLSQFLSEGAEKIEFNVLRSDEFVSIFSLRDIREEGRSRVAFFSSSLVRQQEETKTEEGAANGDSK